MNETRGRYAQKIKWNPDINDYPVRPQLGEDLQDFTDRWLKAARLGNRYIHPDDVADLLLILSCSHEWFDGQFGEYGGAALTPEEVTRLLSMGMLDR